MVAIEMNLVGNHHLESEQNGFVLRFSSQSQEKQILTSPKQLLLHSLAGCTAFDVISILEKSRVEFDDLRIIVEAETTDGVPSTYQSFHIIYQFTGKNIDHQKVKRAVELSQDKYCGVSAMFRKFARVSWEIVYAGNEE